MIFLALACAAELPTPPDHAELRGVEVTAVASGEAFTVRAASATVAGSDVRAEGVRVGQAGAPPLDIRATSSAWDLKARTVQFTGDVVITRGDVTITCPSLQVTYADATTVDKVVATGGVHVSRGERTADAERAELSGKTGELVLTGRPSLAEGPNRLVGERIVLRLDDETATCDGGPSGPCHLVVAGAALPGVLP